MNIEQILDRTPMPKNGIAAILAAAGMAASSPALAQNSVYDERSSSEQNEEWYDPTDWFDGEGDQNNDNDWNNDEWSDSDRSHGDWYEDASFDDQYYYDDNGHRNAGDYNYYSEGRGSTVDASFDDQYYYDDNGHRSVGDYNYYSEGWGYTGSQYDSSWNNSWNNTGWNETNDYAEGDDYAGYSEDSAWYDGPEDQSRKTSSSRRSGSSGETHRQAVLRGELDNWSRVRLQGQPDEHTLVRLRLENGRTALVDLGPNVELSRLNLDRGDRIAVKGDKGMIDDRKVLMAKKVRTGDGTVTMNNWKHSKRKASPMADRATLEGQVQGWSRINLQDQKDSHTLVRLRLENGQTAVVNLGPNVELSRLNLDQGDRIKVMGERGSINDRDVLMARKIQTGEGTVTMNNWDRFDDDQVSMGGSY